jgi:hypothetical protein
MLMLEPQHRQVLEVQPRQHLLQLLPREVSPPYLHQVYTLFLATEVQEMLAPKQIVPKILSEQPTIRRFSRDMF